MRKIALFASSTSPTACMRGAGLAPIRKAGKLPAGTIALDYALEYGSARIEIHEDAVGPGQRVLVIDDVLATGGNTEAAAATGVATARIKTAVYIVAGSSAGIAAVLLVARVGAAEPASNTSFLLNSVAAVVLGGVSLFGGRATIAGPVVGALLLTALVNGLTLMGVAQFYQPLSVGIVVVAAAFLTRFQK